MANSLIINLQTLGDFWQRSYQSWKAPKVPQNLGTLTFRTFMGDRWVNSLKEISLIDDAKCFETLRQLRWTEGMICDVCESKHIIKQGLMRLKALPFIRSETFEQMMF